MKSPTLRMLAVLGIMLSGTVAQAGEQVYYFHNDHLGTPQAMSDAAGRTVWTAEYDPFGKATVNEDSDGDGQIVINNLRFPGQYYDAETGLYYNYYRDYDPATGRYLQPDPVGLLGGTNLYSYVDGNPLSLVDPDGLAACTVLFPDYPIEYAEGKTSTWLGGHGGVLPYDSGGVTQYYEYGRYNPNGPGIVGARLPTDEGNVRRVSVPDLVIGTDGQPTPDSMEALRSALSKKAGHGTRAELSCDANADEKKIISYVQSVANNKDRPKYSWKPWNRNQCRTFGNRAFEAGR